MLQPVAIKRSWIPILALAAWMSAGVGAFLSFPIEISSSSDIGGVVSGATHAFVAALIGIALIAARAYGVSRKTWLTLAILSFAAVVILFFIYLYLRQSWSCPYWKGGRLVIGTHFSAALQSYLQQKNTAWSCEAVMNFIGRTDLMFSNAELLYRYLVLALTYVFVWFGLAATVICIGAGLSGASIAVPRKRRIY